VTGDSKYISLAIFIYFGEDISGLNDHDFVSIQKMMTGNKLVLDFR